MRARFCAHVDRDFGFLHRTHLPTARKPYVPLPGEPTTRWTRLVVHSHAPGRTPDTATVDFSAYGLEDGSRARLQEKAEFIREGGSWLYSRALREGPEPYRNPGHEARAERPLPVWQREEIQALLPSQGIAGRPGPRNPPNTPHRRDNSLPVYPRSP